MNVMRRNLVWIVLAGSLALAGAAGWLASQATGAGQQEPTRTVTVSIRNGATGPQGPVGPPGPPGSTQCPAGSEFGKLVINSPSGHVEILTCIVG